MQHLKILIELTRISKPIGFMLLFWPCTWGLTIVYNFNDSINTYFKYILLFLVGSILMRSAGCIINDIVDKNLDKKVERTKHRPLASNKISIQLAFTYVCILCILAFLILINFNNLTIILALGSMPLAFAYPLMKRITYWPQLFLGITFNYGLILGWTSIEEQINIVPLIMYFGAIFWTLGYDTIYGFQDIKDDEIIGVKSTSIKFKKNPKFFLKLCYLIFITSFFMIGIVMKFNILYFLALCFAVAHLFFYQIQKLNINSEHSCLNIFKSNNILGLIIYISLLTGKIFT